MTSHRITRRECLALLSSLPLLPGCSGDPDLYTPAGKFPPGIHRGPQVALVGPDAVTIAWQTEDPVVGSVAYGLDGSLGKLRASADATRDHVIRLDGLRPTTTYRYQLRLDDRPMGRQHTFRTAPADRQARVRFAVVGDSGSGSQRAYRVAEVMRQANPDLIIHTGDAAYNRGLEWEVYHRFSVQYADLLDHVPLYVTLGNHDVRTAYGRHLLDAVVLPRNPVDGTEVFYSFDHGACHFACIDSNARQEDLEPQLQWLSQDLEASRAPWKFVFCHHPPHTGSRSYGSWEVAQLQKHLVPILERTGVDIHWSGHDHAYQRMVPLRAGAPVGRDQEPDYRAPRAPIYVVTGGGGRSLYEIIDVPQHAMARSVDHAVIVDVEGSRLSMAAVDAEGNTFDRMTITKGA